MAEQYSFGVFSGDRLTKTAVDRTVLHSRRELNINGTNKPTRTGYAIDTLRQYLFLKLAIIFELFHPLERTRLV